MLIAFFIFPLSLLHGTQRITKAGGHVGAPLQFCLLTLFLYLIFAGCKKENEKQNENEFLETGGLKEKQNENENENENE